MNEDYRLVVGLAGLHGAGKSTIAKRLRDSHGFSITSFGGVVRREAEVRGRGMDLTSLQDLGDELIKEWGWERFCGEVLAERQPKTGIVLVDGVRHIATLDHLKKLANPGVFSFVYVDVDEPIRLERLTVRQRPGDHSSTRETHPVEKEVVALKDYAHVVIDNTGDDATEKLIQFIEHRIQK